MEIISPIISFNRFNLHNSVHIINLLLILLSLNQSLLLLLPQKFIPYFLFIKYLSVLHSLYFLSLLSPCFCFLCFLLRQLLFFRFFNSNSLFFLAQFIDHFFLLIKHYFEIFFFLFVYFFFETSAGLYIIYLKVF